MKGPLFLLIMACSMTIIRAQAPLSSSIKPGPTSHLAIPYGNNPAAGKYVQTTDAKIYYETYGKGQPIVLLHGGIMGAIEEMGDFIEQLQDSYYVIVIASRGHGKSEIGKLPITYEAKANDIIRVIETETTDSVTLLGFSDGAYTAYKVASLAPNRVKKLIAIGAGEQIPGLRKVVFSGEAFDLENEFWKKRTALMPEPDRIKSFWASMEQFYNTMSASKALFKSIHCPVLLMAGENDQNAPLHTVINAYHMIPDSQLSIIPHAGHVVFLENFPAVWTSLVPFLNN